jgi:hypothetical protein
MQTEHWREMVDIVTDDYVDCWRINYKLADLSPADAARWWDENCEGRAPSGAVAALGLMIEDRARLLRERDAAVLSERERCARAVEQYGGAWDVTSQNFARVIRGQE